METTEVNLASPAQLRALLAAHRFRPRKRLGQHFLVDRNVLRKAIECARLTRGDQVLEIGPGVGALTQELAEAAGRVVAIEVDKRLEPILRQTLAGRQGVELVFADALDLQLGLWLGEGRWKVVANLPYYLTSPLIARLLEFRAGISRLVLMVQEEVADRLLASPGTKEYGSPSVLVQSHCEVARAARVSRRCFYPSPEVDSALLVLEVRSQPLVPDRLAPLFFSIVHAAFGQRRKTLRNALASLGELPPEKLSAILRQAGVEPGRRGETLAPGDFLRLAAVWAASRPREAP
jgi:16S rRNA (adenine1518-N6/adenine1519-N6)-dimethyltransferase